MLRLARKSLAERTAGRELDIPEMDVPGTLLTNRGCFVTLSRAGELRGCVGHVLPQMKLYLAVAHNASAAGFHDRRFEPVSPQEIPEIEIEVSVLSDLQAVGSGDPARILSVLQPNVDGVCLKAENQLATFLPQVWEIFPGKEEFLSRLCEKAGWSPQTWKNPKVSFWKYQVVAFSDVPDPDGHP